jgi:hypothetical protein
MKIARAFPLFGAFLALFIAHQPVAAAPASPGGVDAMLSSLDVQQVRYAGRGGGGAYRGRSVAVRGGYGRGAVAVRGPHGGGAVAARGYYGGRAVVRGPNGGRAVVAGSRYRVGGRYYGGVWYGTGRRYYGGRWWPYGVGSCWRPSPIGYVWVCG